MAFKYREGWRSWKLLRDPAEKQGFVAVEEVLYADGYERTGGDKKFRFQKKTPEICITVDMDHKKLKKNSYTFSLKDKTLQAGKELYVRKNLMEEVLCAKIEGNRDSGYQLVREDLAAGDWTSGKAPLISHAGGGILEKKRRKLVQRSYTNSLEAFISSYDQGYRVIEMDFQMSSDGVFCATHAWGEEGTPTAKKWKKTKIKKKYTSMVLEDVLAEMAVNTDLYLVIDTKSYERKDEDVIAEYQLIYDQAVECGGEQLAGRIIPQIYEQSEYDLIKQVYAWPSIIYTLYQQDAVPDAEIASFVKDKKDIHVVTIPKRRVSVEFCSLLHDAGKVVYTHTINDTDGLYQWMNQGVDGFYTDTVTPDAYLARYKKH